MSYRIKELRESAGLTQDELAQKAKVARSLIAALESGWRKETSTVTLRKLATALDVSVCEIFLG